MKKPVNDYFPDPSLNEALGRLEKSFSDHQAPWHPFRRIAEIMRDYGLSMDDACRLIEKKVRKNRIRLTRHEIKDRLLFYLNGEAKKILNIEEARMAAALHTFYA